jgi:DNA-binding CsgD family transcriptional regulator
MENLTLNDIYSLNQAIQKIYALSSAIDFGLDTVRIINQLISHDIPAFHIINMRTSQVTDTLELGTLNISTELCKEITATRDRHLFEHPVVQNFPQTMHGAYKISDFISSQELHSQEAIYQSFLRPLGLEDQMMLFLPNTSENIAQLRDADTTFVGYSLNRSQRSFTERDRLMLNLLRPHLFQAYCNVQRYDRLQQKFDRLQDFVQDAAMIALNTEGRVQLTTPQASIWLEAYFPKPSSIWVLPDRLWSWIKHQAASLRNTADPSPPCLPLRIQHADRQLAIRLILKPAENRYLLLLEEQTTSLLGSLELLGLSQRETTVLGWVLQGKENKTIANELGVGESTVRRHLESIYGKFGVSSRTGAIAYALQKLGLLNS